MSVEGIQLNYHKFKLLHNVHVVKLPNCDSTSKF